MNPLWVFAIAFAYLMVGMFLNAMFEGGVDDEAGWWMVFWPVILFCLIVLSFLEWICYLGESLHERWFKK